MRGKAISERIQNRIVELTAQGLDAVKIGKRLGLHARSVRNIIRKRTMVHSEYAATKED